MATASNATDTYTSYLSVLKFMLKTNNINKKEIKGKDLNSMHRSHNLTVIVRSVFRLIFSCHG